MSQSPPPPPSDPYGAQPPAYAGVPGQQVRVPGSGMAITALVLGILGFLGSFIPVVNFVAIVIAIVAVVLGVIAARRAKRGEAAGRGLAITGIVLGAIGIVISILWFAFLGALLSNDSVQDLQDCLSNATTQSDQQQCQQKFSDDFGN